MTSDALGVFSYFVASVVGWGDTQVVGGILDHLRMEICLTTTCVVPVYRKPNELRFFFRGEDTGVRCAMVWETLAIDHTNSLPPHMKQRLAQWGENPETIQDLQEVFVKHVRGEVDSIPWNSGPFSSETSEEEHDPTVLPCFLHPAMYLTTACLYCHHFPAEHIIAELETLNRQGFWTINSQPRVNAASSEDPNVGWGGPGGVVYQKVC